MVRYQDVGSCGAPSGQISVSGPITSREEKEDCGQVRGMVASEVARTHVSYAAPRGQNRSIIKLKPFLRATSDATAESELPFLHHTTSAPHANLPQKCQSRSNTHFHPCLMRPTEVNLLIYDYDIVKKNQCKIINNIVSSAGLSTHFMNFYDSQINRLEF